MSTVIDRMKLSNFSIIADADLDLTNAGLVIVEGLVTDESKAHEELFVHGNGHSNGAGKSTLAEAFYFGLTGEFFDSSTTLGSIVNRFTKKPVSIEISGHKHEDQFKIIRTVELIGLGQKTKHEIKFFVNDEPLHTKAVSNDKIQEQINNFLNINSILLLNSRIYGQGEISSFSKVNDRQKKQIIDQLVGAGICENILKQIKKQLSQLLMELTAEEVNVEKESSRKQQLLENIHDLEVLKDKWQEELASKKSIIISQLEKTQEEINAIQLGLSQLKDYVEDQIIEDYNRVEKLVDDERGKIASVRDLLSSLHSELKIVQSKMDLLKADTHKKDLYLKAINNKTNSEGAVRVCPLCKQPIAENNAEYIRHSITSEIENTNVKIQELHQASIELSQKIQFIERLLNNAEEKLKKDIVYLSDLKTKAESYSDTRLEREKLHIRLESNTKRAQDLALELTKLESVICPHLEMIEQKLALLETSNTKIKELQEKINNLQTSRNCLLFLHKAFDRSGIPLMITNDAINVLNYYLRYYASKFMVPGFDLQYKLEEKRGSEEIVLVINNPYGGSGYHRQSKGEKLKIDLCQMFALGRFAEEQDRCNMNVKWFDEIFSELDIVGCEALLNLLKEDPTPSKFVITHKDLVKDDFDKKITVVKEGKVSRVIA